MNIAIVTAGVMPVPTVKGGAVETLVEYLIDENEKQKKHQFTVFSIQDSAIKQEMIGKYTHTSFKFIKKIEENLLKKITRKVLAKIFKIDMPNNYIKQICKSTKNESYDYILVENRSQYILPLSKVSNNIILHLHNSYLNSQMRKGKSILDKINKVFTVSEFIRKEVETIEINAKIEVLKNCVDLDRFQQPNLKIEAFKYRDDLGIKEDDIVILFAGRIVPEKGVEQLLRAFKKIVHYDNVKLCIVGAAWYSNNVNDEFRNKLSNISEDIKEKIIFTGYVPFEKMPVIYNMGDIGVFPSMWEEPAGLVILESMATGLPIITTDSGGIPEYISERCAIMLDRNNQIVDNLEKYMKKLIEDRTLRYSMAEESKKYVQQFNTQQYYDDFNRLIED